MIIIYVIFSVNVFIIYIYINNKEINMYSMWFIVYMYMYIYK